MALHVVRFPVPEWSLLRTHRGGAHPGAWGRYWDAFSLSVDRTVTLSDFVVAFYTSPVFRLERWILAAVIRRPSTDAEARELAAGRRDSFAAWVVSERTASQILLTDFRERTRSWLAVVPGGTAARPRTDLMFGSGIASIGAETGGGSSSGLLRLHVVYSRALLRAARMRLDHVT